MPKVATSQDNNAVPATDSQKLVCPAELSGGLHQCSAEIGGHGAMNLTIDVPPGQTRLLTVEQLSGSVRVVYSTSDSGQATRSSYVLTNPAGVHSNIRLLVDSANEEKQKLTIEDPAEKPAAIMISVLPAHEVDAQSTQEREAQLALATAEQLRAKKSTSQAEALAAYDKAIGIWQSLKSFADMGRSLTAKSYFIFANQNDPAAALPVIQQAAQYSSSMETTEAASTWKAAGYINAQLSKYDAARDAYTTALKDYEETGDLLNQEVLLENLSRLERLEGNKLVALADATDASALAEKIGDRRGELAIEEQIGSIYATSGDLEPAYDAYQRALALLHVTSDVHMEGYVWSDLGVVYTELGDYTFAHDALDHASEVWKRSPYSFGEMNTLDDNGDLYLAEGKLDQARKFYSQGLEMAEKNSAARYRIFFLRGIGDSYLFENDITNAEINYRHALDLATEAKEGDSTAYIYCALGDTASRKGDIAAAQASYTDCLKDAEAKQETSLTIRAHGGLARLAWQRSDLETAEAQCEEALADIEMQRETLSEVDLRTSYFSSMHAYYDLEIQILARLDQAHPGEGYQWKAFLVAERGRARTLLDEVLASRQESFTDSPSPLKAEYENVQRRLLSLKSQTAQPSTKRGPIAAESIATLTAELHILEQEIGAEQHTGTTTSGAPALTLTKIQAALPEGNSALIEYWTGAEASYAWVISKTSVRMVRLAPGREIERQVAALRKAILDQTALPADVSAELRANRLTAAQQRLQLLTGAMTNALLPRELLSEDSSTVAIVGDGPVLSVPFAMLFSRQRAQTHRPARRVVTFLNEPSAAIFCGLRAHPVSNRARDIAVFVDDDASAKDKNNASAQSTPSLRAKPNSDTPRELSFASSEAAMIQSIFGSSTTHLFSGASATPKAIRALDWNKYSIGHFAMHAKLDSHYAALNGLVTGGETHSMLWYGDVRQMHAPLELVVLSACDTALGQNTPGEGLQGLTQAFLSAGSQRVLGTLWPVDDQATSEWMRHFYVALKSTRSPVKALAAAQREMAATPEWSQPYYWAGFTLAGDWRPLP